MAAVSPPPGFIPANVEQRMLRVRYASMDIEKIGQLMIHFPVLTVAAAIFEITLDMIQDDPHPELRYNIPEPRRIVARIASGAELDTWEPIILIKRHSSKTFPINPGPVVQMETKTLLDFWLKDAEMVQRFVNQVKSAAAQKKTTEESWEEFVAYLRDWNQRLGGDMRLLTDNGSFDGGETSYALAKNCPKLNVDAGTIFGTYRGLWDIEGDLRQLRGFSLLDHKSFRSKDDILSCLDYGKQDVLPESNVPHDHNPENDAIHAGYLYAKILRHNTRTKLKMLRAARLGNVEYLQRQLGKGIHIEQVREYKTGNTLLHIAASRGHLDFVTYLLFVLNVHTDVKNINKRTAREETVYMNECINEPDKPLSQLQLELGGVLAVFQSFKEYLHPSVPAPISATVKSPQPKQQADLPRVSRVLF